MNMLRPLHNPFIIYRGEISMYTVVIADDEEEIRRSLIRKIEWEKDWISDCWGSRQTEKTL